MAFAASIACAASCSMTRAVDDGYTSLFDGKSLAGWTNAEGAFRVEEGVIASRGGVYGYLYSEREYGDFELRLEFKLTPAANNGVAVRASGTGDPAYEGIELQILDDAADEYKTLHEYQFHGSAYGIAPAKRGALKPVGEWNEESIRCVGRRITVTLNGTQILDVDLDQAAPGGKTIDGKEHPGLKRASGHVGLMGHDDVVFFRNIAIKPLYATAPAATAK